MLLLRHGQSEFNVLYGQTRQDPGIRDPGLTDLGRLQASEAVNHVADLKPAQILTSPYSRTLETASIIAESLGVPILATPLIGERAMFECDVGTPVTDLRRKFPHVDFASVGEEIWWPDREEDLVSLDRRCRDFREDCRQGRYTHTLVVTHWGFIRGLTNIRAQNCGIVGYDPDGDHPGGGTVVYNCDTC